jgi:surface-anchored protein
MTVVRRARSVLAVSVTVWSLLALVAAGAAAAPRPAPGEEDPALGQRIDGDQAVATGNAVLDRGHVDLGPAYVDGEWRLMVHDDASDPPVWRDPADVVLRIADAAMVPAPDDPAYGFLGAAPGAPVHVVSQTQQPDVVWIGWNTQHPQVMDRIDRGVTLSLLGVQGPGQLSVYLQSGDFGPPEVLWSSAEPGPQAIWVDVNTHTHANWVATEPGVYLVRIEARADLHDGSTERAVADLRLAVGDTTSTDEALTAAAGPALDRAADAAASEQRPTADPAGPAVAGGGTRWVLWGAVAAAVLLAVAVGSAALQSRRRRDLAAAHHGGGRS